MHNSGRETGQSKRCRLLFRLHSRIHSNVSVGFLDNAVITLSGKELTNIHADCELQFTIVFHALQAFLPYENEDIGSPYLGDTTDRSPTVIFSDVGMPKPLTIENSRDYFKEAFSSIYDDPNEIF